MTVGRRRWLRTVAVVAFGAGFSVAPVATAAAHAAPRPSYAHPSPSQVPSAVAPAVVRSVQRPDGSGDTKDLALAGVVVVVGWVVVSVVRRTVVRTRGRSRGTTSARAPPVVLLTEQ